MYSSSEYSSYLDSIYDIRECCVDIERSPVDTPLFLPLALILKSSFKCCNVSLLHIIKFFPFKHQMIKYFWIKSRVRASAGCWLSVCRVLLGLIWMGDNDDKSFYCISWNIEHNIPPQCPVHPSYCVCILYCVFCTVYTHSKHDFPLTTICLYWSIAVRGKLF